MDYRRDPAVARYQSWTTDYDLDMATAYLGEIEAQPSYGNTLVPPAGEWRQLAVIGRPTGAYWATPRSTPWPTSRPPTSSV